MKTERPNTVSGLLDKRRELAARLKVATVEVATLTTNLDALDTVIRLFAPEADIGGLKEKRLPPPYPARKGEFQRIALSLLRETEAPITSLMLAERFCALRDLKPDAPTLTSLRNRCSNALGHMKGRGLVQQINTPGPYRGWVLTRR